MKVAILVNNDVSHDNRVLKNVRASLDSGFDAVAVGRTKDAAFAAAQQDEVPIVRSVRLSRQDALHEAKRFARHHKSPGLGLPVFVLLTVGTVFGVFFVLAMGRQGMKGLRWIRRRATSILRRLLSRVLRLPKAGIVLRAGRASGVVTKDLAKRAISADWKHGKIGTIPRRTLGAVQIAMNNAPAVRRRNVPPSNGIHHPSEPSMQRPETSFRNWTRATVEIALSQMLRRRSLKGAIGLVHNQIEMLVATYETVVALKPDVIYANDLDTLLSARWAAKTLGIPYIYDAHELEVARSTRSGPITSRVTKVLENQQAKDACHVITVSEGIAGILGKRFAPVPVSVVHNVPWRVDTALCTPTIRTVLGLESHHHLSVYVGLISIYRCLEDFISAFALLGDDHRLAFVGPYHKQAFVDGLLSQASACGLGDRLTILPPVPGPEVSHFISSADLSLALQPVVTESYRLAMPNKLFESTLSGVPLLYSPEQVCITEFVKSHGLGTPIELPLCPENIAAGIGRARRDFARMSAGELSDLQDRYSWQKEFEVIAGIYRGLNGGAPVPPPSPSLPGQTGSHAPALTARRLL